MRRSWRRVLLAAILAAPLVAPTAARAAPDPGVAGPVAVLPFKNLNHDPKLDWLSVGIAETMVSDVKKSGGVQVVERDQIDKALAQIALQGELKMAPATAVKVGKIVGAKTIVLGAYQEAGGRVRITARFVSVETGVVKDAAKVTGPLTRIFHLQDAIVARLLGRRNGHRYHAPKREKGSAKTVKAYRLYAMSLSVASDAQRVTYLQQAVKVDPHFHYAVDALAALEQRMQGYQVLHQRAEHDAVAKLRREIRAGSKAGPMLIGTANQLLAYDNAHHHYYQWLRDLDLLDHSKTVPRTYAGWDRDKFVLLERFMATRMLNRFDVALQYGEAFLKRYPGDSNFSYVKWQMQFMIDTRRKVVTGKAKLAEALEKLAKDRARAVKLHEKYPHSHPRLASFEYRKCQLNERWHQHLSAIELCRAFIQAHLHATKDWVRRLVAGAYFNEIQAYVALGRFDDAWRVLKAARKQTFPKDSVSFTDTASVWPPQRSP